MKFLYETTADEILDFAISFLEANIQDLEGDGFLEGKEWDCEKCLEILPSLRPKSTLERGNDR